MILTSPAFRTRDLALPEATLHLREVGDPEAPVVVWLHGMMGHAYEWDAATARVAERFRIVAIEQRGHGRSSHPGDYRLALFVTDLVAALDRLAIERAHLVGHSMGGLVGAVASWRHPGRIKRLVLLDVGPNSLTTPWARQQLPVLLRDMAAMRFAGIDEATDAWLADDPCAERDLLRHYMEHALVTGDTGRYQWRFDALHLDTFLQDADPAELWAVIDHLCVPTLLVRGEHSHLLTAAHARTVVNRLPDGHLVEIPGAGHDLGVQRPGAVAEACLSWLTH